MSKKNDDFEKVLSRLNPNQRKAVDAIEGPVMVIAGPGTGKTQILSARIANILKSGAQVNPDNILCLTYTNAGRTAMRERLIQLTDTPTANAVNIHTFHSFCNDVIQMYPESFAYDLTHIDELEQMDLLRRVQDTIPTTSPIYMRRYSEKQLPELKRVFDFIKKEDIDTEDLIASLKNYADNLESDEDFVYQKKYKDNQPGDPKKAKIQDERSRVNKAIERIQLFPIYQEMMLSEGFFDFNDMIRWVNEALEKSEELKLDLQEKYQYILVDEFQDTNGAQFKLIELLTQYDHHDAPNIFVVGDDDQSIYRFQGANMKNLLDFRTQYQDSIYELVLDQNYRSSQVILDGAQQVIEHNQNRLIDAIPGLEKNLRASNPNVADLGIKPRVFKMVNASQEYIHIAKDIQTKISEGVTPSDIAVLYPKHKYGNDFVKYLSALGVPYYMHKELNFLEDPMALMLVDLLRYLDTESREYDAYPNLLFEIFGFPFWGAAKDTGFMILDSYHSHRESKQSFRSYVHQWVEKNKNRSDLKYWEESVIKIYSIVEELILDAQQQSLPVLINKVITKTGLHSYILERPNKFWNLEILKTLVDKCDEVYDKHPADGLRYLLDEFQLMSDSGIIMPVTKLLGTKSGVNMMSIHGSKGLEFAHVYMISSSEKCWDDTKRSGNDLTVPTGFFQKMISNTDSESDPEEKRRLFYVGITRAEKTLTISIPIFDASGKVSTPVKYVSELLEAYDNYEPVEVTLDPEEIQELEWNSLTQSQDMLIEPSEREVLSERLKDYSISVTGLHNYLECPVRFYYNNLLRVPSGRSVALDYGNLMHQTLENYYIEAQKKGEHLGADRLIEIYDREVARNEEKFIDDKIRAEIDLGREELRMFYNQELLGSGLDVDLEQKLVHTFDHGLRVTGVIDRVEIHGDDITIVDYKTGKPDAAKVKAPNLGARGAGKINSYWLQGFFYKLLAQNSPRYSGKQISEVNFVFLTPTEEKTFLKAPMHVDDQQYEFTMEKVYEAWDKIRNLEFSEGCGDEKCYWCNYQKAIARA